MMNVFSGSFWYDWHTQITFQLIKVLFSLTAVPFFIFTIGPLAKLFAHTDPTAYTRDGRITVPDPNGLSSYLRWIKEDVLNSKVPQRAGRLPRPSTACRPLSPPSISPDLPRYRAPLAGACGRAR